MPRLGGRTPLIIEDSDETPVREIRSVWREKVIIANERLSQFTDFLLHPFEDIFQNKVKLVLAEIGDPARVFLADLPEFILMIHIGSQLIRQGKVERARYAIILLEKIFIRTEGDQGIALPDAVDFR